MFSSKFRDKIAKDQITPVCFKVHDDIAENIFGIHRNRCSRCCVAANATQTRAPQRRIPGDGAIVTADITQCSNNNSSNRKRIRATRFWCPSLSFSCKVFFSSLQIYFQKCHSIETSSWIRTWLFSTCIFTWNEWTSFPFSILILLIILCLIQLFHLLTIFLSILHFSIVYMSEFLKITAWFRS